MEGADEGFQVNLRKRPDALTFLKFILDNVCKLVSKLNDGGVVGGGGEGGVDWIGVSLIKKPKSRLSGMWWYLGRRLAIVRRCSQASGLYGVRALSFLSLRACLSSVVGLTASRGNVTFVVPSARTTTSVLPISAEWLSWRRSSLP